MASLRFVGEPDLFYNHIKDSDANSNIHDYVNINENNNDAVLVKQPQLYLVIHLLQPAQENTGQ